MNRHPWPKTSECSRTGEDVQGRLDAAWLLAGRCAPNASLYVHVPFCFHKCHYCDFYSIVDDKGRQEAFTERLIGEAHALAAVVPIEPRTVFVGGGTPTLLEPRLWSRLLEGWRGAVDFSRVEEFTVEANPETVTEELMGVLVGGGVNRVSIGAQSFDPGHLKTLERWHDPANVGRAVGVVRAAGIENFNLDLIFGVPGQTLEQWREDLRRVLELGPTHASCYSLTYEPNTPLRVKMEAGKVKAVAEELSASMFEGTMEVMGGAGFEQYEVSNFALPGRRCGHNVNYWMNGDWLALGPSASGHVGGVRWKNVPRLGSYLAGTGTSEVQDVEELGADESVGEQLMMRFRLIEGVENGWLESTLDGARKACVSRFVGLGLLERTATHTRLTRRGLMVADSVLSELL